jgi:hypothetical protein
MGGSGRMGGGGGSLGPATSSCEAFCAGSCVFGGLDPEEDGYAACMSDCLEFMPAFADDCGPEAEAYIGCCADHECNCGNQACFPAANAWSASNDA